MKIGEIWYSKFKPGWYHNAESCVKILEFLDKDKIKFLSINSSTTYTLSRELFLYAYSKQKPLLNIKFSIKYKE